MGEQPGAASYPGMELGANSNHSAGVWSSGQGLWFWTLLPKFGWNGVIVHRISKTTLQNCTMHRWWGCSFKPFWVTNVVCTYKYVDQLWPVVCLMLLPIDIWCIKRSIKSIWKNVYSSLGRWHCAHSSCLFWLDFGSDSNSSDARVGGCSGKKKGNPRNDVWVLLFVSAGWCWSLLVFFTHLFKRTFWVIYKIYFIV